MMDHAAANSIRDVLSGLQIDNGSRLIGMAMGERSDPHDFVIQGLLGLGIIAFIPLATRFLKNAFSLMLTTSSKLVLGFLR